ncbi:hypothetical protein [Bacillus safensis]
MAVFILFIVFGFPIISVLIGIFGTLLLKNVWMPTLIVLLASMIFMFTYIGGNESFPFGLLSIPSLHSLLGGLQSGSSKKEQFPLFFF